MRALFRWVSVIEGLSLLVLIGIAMPAKYYFDNHTLVPIVGMTHGVLWLCYIIISLIVAQHQRWSMLLWVGLLVLSVMPFGFLVTEWLLRRQIPSD